MIMLVLMVFTNQGNMINQRKTGKKIAIVNAEKQAYLQKILDIQKSQSNNFSDLSAMEKYARENYYMKKDGETVYVIVDAANKPISVEEK
jgi:cell division protein DivIC